MDVSDNWIQCGGLKPTGAQTKPKLNKGGRTHAIHMNRTTKSYKRKWKCSLTRVHVSHFLQKAKASSIALLPTHFTFPIATSPLNLKTRLAIVPSLFHPLPGGTPTPTPLKQPSINRPKPRHNGTHASPSNPPVYHVISLYSSYLRKRHAKCQQTHSSRTTQCRQVERAIKAHSTQCTSRSWPSCRPIPWRKAHQQAKARRK